MEQKEQSVTPNKAVEPKKENFFWDLFKFSVIVLVIVVPIRMYIAQPFIVHGESMDPNFSDGQYLIVDQLSYHFENPKRGEVVIFRYPKEPSTFFIKRIIGLPGETVILDGNTVSIKNADYPNGFTISEPYIPVEKDDYGTYTLKAGEYFVMGDNRAHSSDSRAWGPVPRNLIVGRPLIRLFPINTVSVFPADHATN